METKAKYVNVDTSNFDAEVLEADGPVLVDFYADWCAPCRAIAPTIEALAVEFDGRAKVAKLDVDESPEIAQRYGVASIPALLIFRNGEVVEHSIGAYKQYELAEKLELAALAA